MDWSSEGYIVAIRKHGESSVIIDVLTPDMGRHAGLVRGGNSKRMRPVLQLGNKVKIDWRARLSDHLGHFTVEPLTLSACLLYTSPSPRDQRGSRMPSSA